MDLDWQLIGVVACVIWAAAVLFRRGCRLFLKPSSSGCGSGGCHDCPSNSMSPSNGLIQLGLPERKADE